MASAMEKATFIILDSKGKQAASLLKTAISYRVSRTLALFDMTIGPHVLPSSAQLSSKPSSIQQG